MSKTYQLDQMKLIGDIAEAIEKQQPIVPADSRANVVLEAANLIVEAYKITNEEYIAKRDGLK